MSADNPIGLFDSGVGGLSVLVEIKKILPNESFVFLADQAHNPYGAKTKNELENLSERITKFLLKFDIKLLVVACNTATCYAISHLRSQFTIPIVGVVPAIKPAASLTIRNKIAVMSTPSTAKSAYLSSLVKTFAFQTRVLKIGCDGLEESIEYLKINEISRLLDVYCPQIKKFGADVVVLGCTHFPFIKGKIKKRLSPRVKIIDSGQAIAHRVETILKTRGQSARNRSQDIYFTTGNAWTFSKVASTLLKYNVAGKKARI